VIASELHTFCDASEEAFAAVVYLRSIYDDYNIRCSFLMAKTKVAPKKALNVARLGLQAALLGAHLANYVKKAMTQHIDRVFFWTNSKCIKKKPSNQTDHPELSPPRKPRWNRSRFSCDLPEILDNSQETGSQELQKKVYPVQERTSKALQSATE
jgi:hypothetical protein